MLLGERVFLPPALKFESQYKQVKWCTEFTPAPQAVEVEESWGLSRR